MRSRDGVNFLLLLPHHRVCEKVRELRLKGHIPFEHQLCLAIEYCKPLFHRRNVAPLFAMFCWHVWHCRLLNFDDGFLKIEKQSDTLRGVPLHEIGVYLSLMSIFL